MGYKINKQVYYRYEPNIENGTLLVYFKDSKNIFEMSEPYHIFLQCLSNKKNMSEIQEHYKEIYKELEESEINASINDIINSLLEIDVIINA